MPANRVVLLSSVILNGGEAGVRDLKSTFDADEADWNAHAVCPNSSTALVMQRRTVLRSAFGTPQNDSLVASVLR